MQEVKKTEEFEKNINSGKVCVVDFFTTWCGPCRIVAPVLESISKENKDENVIFFKVDCDVLGKLADDFGVRSVPTIIIFKDGKKVGDLLVGRKDKEDYLKRIEETKKQVEKEGEKKD